MYYFAYIIQLELLLLYIHQYTFFSNNTHNLHIFNTYVIFSTILIFYYNLYFVYNFL